MLPSSARPATTVPEDVALRRPAVDQKGETARLHAAPVDFFDIAMTEPLVEAGADPSLRGPEGRSALELAHEHGHSAIAAVLAAPGASAGAGR